jgi:hypothetical protein
MAIMNHEDRIHRKIAELFHQYPWRGLISVEEAIADAIRYRSQLCDADRALYDEQIELGVHPCAALQTVEVVSGRDRPHGSEPAREPAAAK